MIFKTIKLALWSLFAAGAFALMKAAFAAPAIVETVYSRTIYPFFTRTIGSLTSKTNIDIGEILLYLFAAFVISFIVFILRALFKPSGSRLFHFIRRMLGFAITLCMLYTLFVAGWGLNYARQPLSESMNLSIEQYTSDDLANVCALLAEKTNTLRTKVNEDDNGVFTLSSAEKQDMLSSVAEEYESGALDFMKLCVSSRVKAVAASELLSYLETQGIFNPFTYEANVNTHMPDLYYPSTLAHEYAHLQGFAREDEANFLAWYVLRNSSNANYSYSAYVLALTYGMNELYKTGNPRFSEIVSFISDGVIRDLKFNREYWNKYETDFSQGASDIYNIYLKENVITDGVQSYGRMMDLIIALNKQGSEAI